MKVHYTNPWATDKNIGKAFNEFCESVPDGDWICLQDGDMLYLTPDWGAQIEAVIANHGNDFSLFGCLTNRLGRKIQVYDWDNYDNHNIKDHYKIAKDLSEKHFAEVEDITETRFVAGLLMLFPKSVWEKHKFRETGTPLSVDDAFSRSIVKSGGRLGLMRGLYVYHLYRIWSSKPHSDTRHLFKNK